MEGCLQQLVHLQLHGHELLVELLDLGLLADRQLTPLISIRQRFLHHRRGFLVRVQRLTLGYGKVRLELGVYRRRVRYKTRDISSIALPPTEHTRENSLQASDFPVQIRERG